MMHGGLTTENLQYWESGGSFCTGTQNDIWKTEQNALLDGGEKSRMIRAMTLKFEKSYEVHVEISDIPVFVKKYLCQERRCGVRLLRWKRLPERWMELIVSIGVMEAVTFYFLRYPAAVCVEQAVGISRCSGYRPDGNSVVRDRQPVGTGGSLPQ